MIIEGESGCTASVEPLPAAAVDASDMHRVEVRRADGSLVSSVGMRGEQAAVSYATAKVAELDAAEVSEPIGLAVSRR